MGALLRIEPFLPVSKVCWEGGDRAARFHRLGANYMLEAMRADVVSRDMVARCFPIATFAKVANSRRWRG